MRHPRIALLSVWLLVGGTAAHAEKQVIDCSKGSLADAVAGVKEKEVTMEFTGVCAGPIVIRTDGLTLQGVGAAVIDGGGQSAVTIAGASGVTLSDFDVRNGLNQARVLSTQNGTTGLVADNGAGLTLVNSTVTGNATKDIQMTFGTRADLRTLVFGTYTCDATVLVRGTSGITCPH